VIELNSTIDLEFVVQLIRPPMQLGRVRLEDDKGILLATETNFSACWVEDKKLVHPPPKEPTGSL
jgi:hypothetical protein